MWHYMQEVYGDISLVGGCCPSDHNHFTLHQGPGAGVTNLYTVDFILDPRDFFLENPFTGISGDVFQ